MAEHRFELIGRVALTATSTVWKARDVGLDRVVALKQLHSADPVLRQRWRDEAHALGSLDERHVVSVYGLYEDPDSAWLIEQWIDGATLATVVRSAGPLSPEQGVGVVRGALLGLAHAHGRGIIHRDLSLSNIMLDQWGESVLIDFGLAAPPGEHGSSGTAAFQSPEARAGQPITERSDIYSMGAILGHLLAGSSETPRGLERPMREVIERAMTTDPAGRFASAQELLSALEQAAKQTYGPAWLLQASVVGLVSGVSAAELLAPATGGAAVPGVGVSLTDAPGAAEPEAPPPGDAWPGAVESGPLVSAPVTEARRERPRLPRRRLLAGGGAAAVIAVIVVAVVLSSGSSDHKPRSVAQPTVVPTTRPPSPTPTTSSSSASAGDRLSGTYSVREQLVTSNNYGGGSRTDTWTIRARCDTSGCIALSSAQQGDDLTFSFDGARWISTTAGAFSCQDASKPIGLVSERTVLVPDAPTGDAPIVTLTGTQTITITGGDCPGSNTFRVRLTRAATTPAMSSPTVPPTAPVAVLSTS